MIVIGITGSIGMGKSTAAEMLRDLGVPIHDSDASVHRLLGPDGGAVKAVGEKFPEALKKGSDGKTYIDRKILGRAVFADRKKKKTLEDILHPMVRSESDRFKEIMEEKGHDVIALDIPLLFETGGEDRVDLILCVSASAEVQKERVLARPGMTSEKFDKIVAGQMPDSEKRKRADHVIDSNVSFDKMRQQLSSIVEGLRLSPKARKKKS